MGGGVVLFRYFVNFDVNRISFGTETRTSERSCCERDKNDRRIPAVNSIGSPESSERTVLKSVTHGDAAARADSLIRGGVLLELGGGKRH